MEQFFIQRQKDGPEKQSKVMLVSFPELDSIKRCTQGKQTKVKHTKDQSCLCFHLPSHLSGGLVLCPLPQQWNTEKGNSRIQRDNLLLRNWHDFSDQPLGLLFPRSLSICSCDPLEAKRKREKRQVQGLEQRPLPGLKTGPPFSLAKNHHRAGLEI